MKLNKLLAPAVVSLVLLTFPKLVAELEVVAIAGEVSPGGPGVFNNSVGRDSYRVIDFAEDGRVALSAPLIATASYPNDDTGAYVFSSDGVLSFAAQNNGSPFYLFSGIKFLDEGYVLVGTSATNPNGEVTYVKGDAFERVLPSEAATSLEVSSLRQSVSNLSSVISANGDEFSFVVSLVKDGVFGYDLLTWGGEFTDWSLTENNLYENLNQLSDYFEVNDLGDVYSRNFFVGHQISKDETLMSYAVPLAPTPDGLGTFSANLDQTAKFNNRGELLFEAEVTEFDGSRSTFFFVDSDRSISEMPLANDVSLFGNRTLGPSLIDYDLEENGTLILSGLSTEGTGDDLMIDYVIANLSSDLTYLKALDFADYAEFDGAFDSSFNAYNAFGAVSTSGNGHVAFYWVNQTGATEAIYTYDFNTDELRKVVEVGTYSIDGSPIASLDTHFSPNRNGIINNSIPDYVNESGQVVFMFELEDGRSGVARWSPNDVLPIESRETVIVGEDAFTVSPESYTSVAGKSVYLQATAAHEDVQIRWRKNGIELEDQVGRSTLRIRNISDEDSGTYEAFYELNDKTYRSEEATLTIDSDAKSELVNISTRGYMEGGDRVLIGGIVIEGDTSTEILARASGPALETNGVASGFLTDPAVTIVKDGELVAVDDNWDWETKTVFGNLSLFESSFSSVGAFPWELGSLDAALIETLEPQVHTVVVTSSDGANGITLFEAYKMHQDTSRLINISTRGYVDSGDKVLIGGFVIEGDAAMTVLIRAAGPSLVKNGLTNDLLANPSLLLLQGANVLQTNDDWESGSLDASELEDLFLEVGAFTWDSGSADAAIVATLNPGAYTAIVGSADGNPGIGLVEIYEVREEAD